MDRIIIQIFFFLTISVCSFQNLLAQNEGLIYSTTGEVSVDDRRLKADSLFEKREYKQATVQYEEIFKTSALDEEGLENLGLCQAEIKDFKKSIFYLSLAIEKNPRKSIIYKHRGYSFMMQRMLDESIADYQQYLKTNPDDAETYFLLGSAYEYRQDFRAGLNSYILALKNNNQYEEAQFKMGMMLGKLGQFQEAIKCFDASIGMNPKNGEYYLNRGKAKGRIKLPFCEDFKSAIQLGNEEAKVMVSHFCR